MSPTNRSSGNVLAMLAVALGILAVLLVFFVMNYNQLMGTHKEAQSAIDAAALEAAKQIAQVTVPSELGQIGLVDYAGEDPNNPLRNASMGGKPTSEAPVVAFNTALATIRLDLLIAQDLGSEDMKVLAQRDLDRLKVAAEALHKKITETAANGSAAWETVRTTYNANNRRLGGPGALVDGSLKITLGRLESGAGATNVPIPTPPDSASSANNNGGFYKANIAIPAWGENIVFLAVAQEPALVESSKFISVSDGSFEISGSRITKMPPTVVKVEADNKITGFTGSPEKPESILHATACAQAGGQRLSARSTAYTIGFAGSFPSTKSFPQLTVKALLDHGGWQTPNQSGTWLKCSNGQYPGAPMDEVAFHKKKIDNPSTALAYGLYDWLRSLGLRPNLKLTHDMLTTNEGNMRGQVQAHGVNFDDNGDPEGSSDQLDDNQWFDDTKAEDDAEENPPVLGCMIGDPSGEEDEGYLALKNNWPEGATLYSDAFNYRSATESCPNSGIPILLDPVTGSAVPPAGNNIVEMCQFVEGMLATNRAAVSAMMAAKPALDKSRAAQDFIKKTASPALAALQKAYDTGNAQTPKNFQPLYDQLVAMKGTVQSYLALPAMNSSPPGSSVLTVFNAYLSQGMSLSTAPNVYQSYHTSLTNSFETMEKARTDEMADRAMRVARNAKRAGQGTYAIFRRLLKYSGKGVRRIDRIDPLSNMAAIDLFPDNPVFVSKIRSRGPRVNFVMPNNMPNIIRTGDAARPYFFNLDFYELGSPEINALEKSILSVQYDGKEFDEVELSSGSTKMPVDKKYPKAERWNWDTAPRNDRPADFNDRIGRFANIKYKQRNVEGGDPSVEWQPIKVYKDQVKAAFNNVNIIDGAGRSSTAGSEQVFVLYCDGDASNGTAGRIRIEPVTGKDNVPRYPFGSNYLHNNQFLYYSSYSFRDGEPGTGLANAPVSTYVYRTVMARDQFADLSGGESFKLQSPENWCQAFGVRNWSDSKCPYPAGEWRIGNPYSIGCCQEPPASGKKKQDRNRWSVRVPGLPTSDPDTSLGLPTDEDLDVCPRAIRLKKLHLRQ